MRRKECPREPTPMMELAALTACEKEAVGPEDGGGVRDGAERMSLPPKLAEALGHIEGLCEFAYAQGFHELGYDPVKVVRAALQHAPREATQGMIDAALDMKYGPQWGNGISPEPEDYP